MLFLQQSLSDFFQLPAVAYGQETRKLLAGKILCSIHIQDHSFRFRLTVEKFTQAYNFQLQARVLPHTALRQLNKGLTMSGHLRHNKDSDNGAIMQEKGGRGWWGEPRTTALTVMMSTRGLGDMSSQYATLCLLSCGFLSPGHRRVTFWEITALLRLLCVLRSVPVRPRRVRLRISPLSSATSICSPSSAGATVEELLEES